MKIIASPKGRKSEIRIRPEKWETFMAKAQKQQGLLRLQKILVPIDFSEPSSKALWYSMAFARQFRTTLVLLHVVEIPYAAGEMGVMISPLPEKIREQAVSELEALKKELGNVSVETKVRVGTPYHEITEAARELAVDLIIIATHGHRGITRLVLGSTAERVVRHAPCPVLVVRAEEREFITGEPAKAASRFQRSGRPSSRALREPRITKYV